MIYFILFITEHYRGVGPTRNVCYWVSVIGNALIRDNENKFSFVCESMDVWVWPWKGPTAWIHFNEILHDRPEAQRLDLVHFSLKPFKNGANLNILKNYMSWTAY